MTLTGSLLERTQEAIVANFDRAGLQQFVRLRLNMNFEAIVRDHNLAVQVYELLLWAGLSGREQELLDKLLAQRPHDVDLAAVATALRKGERLAPPVGYLPGGYVPGSEGRGPFPLQRPLRTQHFTGRETQLAKLLAELQPGRILTLCGPGGMGKTALAAEAVWRLAPDADPPARFPGGVIFHTFYHQPQASLALEAIARACGIDPRPSAQDAARLALANRQALLVLDGAEAADDLAAVLQVAGSCGVLITTRRRGDAPAALQDLDPLPRPESLALLRAWAGPYAAGDEAANEVVRLLGGLPLALFLVGRYLFQRRQGASEYVAWLQEAGLGALHFADRPSKSVPLLLARSLGQVSAAAQAAFGVAGVLALAPFAAEAVAAALDITPPAASRALGELVDYGLLLRPDDHYQVTHALAHAYARTQAAPAAEVVGRLALHYAALAESESQRGPAGFAVLDRYRAHIVAVQAAALRAEQWDAVREITWQAIGYLDFAGHTTERLTVVHTGLDAARASRHSYDEMMLLNALGLTYGDLGEIGTSIKVYERSLALARKLGDWSEQVSTLGNLGLAYANLGDPHRAIRLYEQVLVIAHKTGDLRAEGAAFGNLGNVYENLGDIHHAIECHEQALVIIRKTVDRRSEAITLGNLGNSYLILDEPQRAIDLYEQQLVIAREIGDRRGEGNSFGNIGNSYLIVGEQRRAIDLYEQQLVITREITDRRGEGNALCNLGSAYYLLGETRRAIDLYEQQLVIVREIGDRRGEALASWNLGLVYEEEGDLIRAAEFMQVRVAYEQELGHPAAAADAQRVAELRAQVGLPGA